MTLISGRCLCETVQYKIASPPLSQGICYCFQCQRAGGAWGSPLLVVHRDAFEYSPNGLSFYKTKSDDGSSVKRNFCRECGSPVFAEILDAPEIVTVKAATLDDFTVFVPEYLVWTQNAGRFCTFPPGVPSFAKDAPLETVLGTNVPKFLKPSACPSYS